MSGTPATLTFYLPLNFTAIGLKVLFREDTKKTLTLAPLPHASTLMDSGSTSFQSAKFVITRFFTNSFYSISILKNF